MQIDSYWFVTWLPVCKIKLLFCPFKSKLRHTNWITNRLWRMKNAKCLITRIVTTSCSACCTTITTPTNRGTIIIVATRVTTRISDSTNWISRIRFDNVHNIRFYLKCPGQWPISKYLSKISAVARHLENNPFYQQDHELDFSNHHQPSKLAFTTRHDGVVYLCSKYCVPTQN